MVAFNKGERMETFTITEDVMLASQEAAKALLDSDLEIKEVTIGEKETSIFVSSNPKLVVPLKTQEVGGTTFYVGFKA